MIKVDKSIKDNAKQLQDMGITLPKFDWQQMVANTVQRPTYIHFGVGNIFRGYIARLQQDLLNLGKVDTGVIGVLTYEDEICQNIFALHDNMTVLAALGADGEIAKQIVASLVSCHMSNDYDKLVHFFEQPSLQMVGFSITEKGYQLHQSEGGVDSLVAKDIESGPGYVSNTMVAVTGLLLRRFLAGGHPIAMVSMDNCSHNGDILKRAVVFVARAWVDKGYASREFLGYIEDDKRVSFPLTMIDKITPRPAEIVHQHLVQLGLQDMTPMVSQSAVFVAPFVNAEEAEYLVVEDNFPNGRPPLNEVGVYFVDRQTVNKVETMKVSTCLNPLHTALAVCGCLLGYTSISSEMHDRLLRALVDKIADEGLKTVVDPKVVDPVSFVREVIEVRLPNPFVPDTPQRIATDTSQKVGIRFGQTIKAYIARSDLNVGDLVGIPLALASWLRYLLGVDDKLQKMQLSADPMLGGLQALLHGVQVGDPQSVGMQLKNILSNDSIFGLDLSRTQLFDKIEQYFLSMLKGGDAVKDTLTAALLGSNKI